MLLATATHRRASLRRRLVRRPPAAATPPTSRRCLQRARACTDQTTTRAASATTQRTAARQRQRRLTNLLRRRDAHVARERLARDRRRRARRQRDARRQTSRACANVAIALKRCDANATANANAPGATSEAVRNTGRDVGPTTASRLHVGVSAAPRRAYASAHVVSLVESATSSAPTMPSSPALAATRVAAGVAVAVAELLLLPAAGATKFHTNVAPFCQTRVNGLRRTRRANAHCCRRRQSEMRARRRQRRAR